MKKRLAVAALAGLFLLLGGRISARRRAATAAGGTAAAARKVAPVDPGSTPAVSPAHRWVAVVDADAATALKFADAQRTNRLRNTLASPTELLDNPRALLLRNALVDTGAPDPLGVPKRLRSAHPGGYVVQAMQGVTPAFRGRLLEAGLEIVSYIPNNALLVTGAPEAAERAAGLAEVSAVLPFEPYFKLEPTLITAGLAPAGALDAAGVELAEHLVVTTSDPDQASRELAALGAVEMHRERGPFGELITVQTPRPMVAEIAQIASVQLVEPWRRAVRANDRTGVILGSTTNFDNTGKFLGLTGKGVLVNVNDSGIDNTHPDLTGRVYTVPGATNANGLNLLTDVDGHGTHVAGIIAGTGASSASLAGAEPQGSVAGANFQGKAPGADLFILPVDLIQGPVSGDEYLQETAALATSYPSGRPDLSEPLISNNSWGYLTYEYDSHSASYDAAVRDALPDMTGDQPILYVFAAGNYGNGGDNGVGGDFDTIISPGNAKNVITVGALESARNLTNTVVYDTNFNLVFIDGRQVGPYNTNATYYTNQAFGLLTGTDFEVAGFSSRGNVGIGTEGDAGRFKPDVVAPGVFTISTRSSQWSLTNDISPQGDPGTYGLFQDLDQETAPWYRYDSGTSMATPAIAGLLAQMQEFFRQSSNGPSPSAAGYKAILLNSATVTTPTYNPDPHNSQNYAGWGEPYLPFALQPNVLLSGATGRSQFVIQSDDPVVSCAGGGPCLGLRTGESMSFALNLSSNAASSYVHLTLVWTDPPGNPAAASKLVNDLDVVVSNVVTGEVYVGNQYDSTSGLSAVLEPGDVVTNSAAQFDRLNNVERIDFDPAGNSSFIVTVAAHLVNVNARRDHPDDIVQDFALAVRSDYIDASGASSGSLTASSTALQIPGFGPLGPATLTNGTVLFAERVGANSPLIGGVNGQTNQWRFYVFTNSPGITTNGDLVLTNGSNVAFITFPVGNLSQARTNGPDIDLYVSLDSSLTNLNPAAVAGAFKSTGRGADEMVVFTNAPANGEVYYIGVKSEDQQAAEYGFIGISTTQPFNSIVNGIGHPLGIPLIQPIPDGTPDRPGKGLFLAVSTFSRQLRRITATVTTSHQHFGDLLGDLSHSGSHAVLDNHSRLNGLDYGTNVSVTYDDTHTIAAAQPTDGPGSLISFLGYGSSGAWFLTSIDNALGNTGRVNKLDLGLLPNDFGETLVERCILGGGNDLEVIDVPPNASQLTITITNIQPALPLEVYIKREDLPDTNNVANDDKFATVEPPGASITIGLGDVPPLLAGRYFILIHNPNAVQVCFGIRGHLDLGLDSRFTHVYSSTNPVALADMARTTSGITVNDGRPVTSVEVGLLVEHPRESDLAVRLFNPQGDAAMVVENRGLTTASGFGGTVLRTNGAFSHVALTWDRITHVASLYVNGQLSATGVFAGYEPVTSDSLYFGSDPSGQLLPGSTKLGVDDFGLWSKALLPADIAEIYNNGLLGLGKTGASRVLGLTALWPFDGTGADTYGNNNVNLLGFSLTIPGQIGQAIEFDSVTAQGRVDASSSIDVAVGSGFTLDGWVDLASTTPVLVAGWGNATPPVIPAPAILANAGGALGKGAGSISAFFGYGADGQPRLLTTPAGIAEPGVVTTNRIYALFNDDTNSPVAKMIKFATPPFLSDVESRLRSVSDFETNAAGFVTAGQEADGWLVQSGVVQQFYDADVAYSGIGFISMAKAQILRSFDVLTNRTYIVSFANRLAPNPNGRPAGVVFSADGTVVDTVIPEAIWQTNVYVFNPTNTPLVLSFTTITNAADVTLLDDIQITETSGSFYLPEEPFTPILGGSGAGQWGLEVKDGRVGETGTLDSWQLTITFGATNPPAVTLTNGLDFATNVTGGGIQYFIVNVPPEALVVTNYLLSNGGPLNLLYDQTGLPDGTQPNDYLLLSGVTTPGQSTNLSPGLLPPLVRGQRYYLGVQNPNLGQTNSFDIRVDFAIPITPLTNGMATAGTNQNQGLIDYYSFDVPTGALKVLFSLSNMTADVNLVVSKAPQLPTRTQYAYASANAGLGPDYVGIDINSQPVPLSAGRWYVGVYSAGNPPLNPIGYTLAVQTYTDGTPLTNGVPVTSTDLAGVDYYYLDIPSGAVNAVFALTNLSANADLYVRLGSPPPGPNHYDYSSVNGGVQNEVIALTPNSLPVALGPGRWYIAVVPVDPTPIRYTVLASYVTGLGYTDLTNGVPLYAILPGQQWSELYRFIAPTNTSGILFELYDLTTPATLYASFGDQPALDPNALSSGSGNLPAAMIVVRTNIATNDLAGTYFLEVRATNTVDGQYAIRAVTEADGLLVSGQPTLLTVVSSAANGLPTDLQFNAVPGEFYEVEYIFELPPSGQIGAWIPVPPPKQVLGTGGTLPLQGVNPGTNANVFYRVIQTVQP